MKKIISIILILIITSIIPPEKAYEKMVSENRNIDTIDQLIRRIDYVEYHDKRETGYVKEIIPMDAYINKNDAIMSAMKAPDWIRKAELQMIMEDYSKDELPF